MKVKRGCPLHMNCGGDGVNLKGVALSKGEDYGVNIRGGVPLHIKRRGGG